MAAMLWQVLPFYLCNHFKIALWSYWSETCVCFVSYQIYFVHLTLYNQSINECTWPRERQNYPWLLLLSQDVGKWWEKEKKRTKKQKIIWHVCTCQTWNTAGNLWVKDVSQSIHFHRQYLCSENLWNTTTDIRICCAVHTFFYQQSGGREQYI